MTIETDVQSLDAGALVTLFEFDLTALGGGVSRFHAGTNNLTVDVVWDGNTYLAWPIQATGFEARTKGAIPRPTVTVANVTQTLSDLVDFYDDLIGGKLTRIRTFAKYLDAVNFSGGVNPDANPAEKFPDDVWFVDRKVVEDEKIVTFELAAPWDVEGVFLPRRQIVRGTCLWGYRSAECSYSGGAVAKKDDTATAVLAEDECGKRISSCKLRFGNYGDLPFGGFPGAGRFV